MNIYLDIEGVLTDRQGRAANFVVDFLKYFTENHKVFWLTTHCRGGESNVLMHLQDRLPAEALQYLEKIQPTNWQTLKTEAIDFTQDFRWFDDHAFSSEEKILKQNNAEDKLVLVDLNANPNQLKSFL